MEGRKDFIITFKKIFKVCFRTSRFLKYSYIKWFNISSSILSEKIFSLGFLTHTKSGYVTDLVFQSPKKANLTRPHSQALLPEFCINWLNDNHEAMVWSFVIAYNQPAFLSS